MLAPHELNKTFQKSMMGYNPADVDKHIAFIIEKYTEVYNANMELEKKLQMVLSKLEELKSEESSIRSSLVRSQNIGEKIIRDARERAEIIQGSVEDSCNEVIARFRNQLNAEKNELLNMRASILEFRKQIFDMYKAHIYELQNIPVGELEELVLPENSEIIKSIYKDSAEKIKKFDDSKKMDSADKNSKDSKDSKGKKENTEKKDSPSPQKNDKKGKANK